MSEPVTDPSTLNDGLSMLYEGLSLIKGFVKFFGFFALFFLALSGGFFTFVSFIALYILGLLIGAVVPVAVTEIIGNDPSGERACGPDITNSVLFTVFILAALDKYYLFKEYWHALGVGWILLGGLVVIELVVVGIIRLCTCGADANAKRKKKKQDGLRLGTFADAATQKDGDGLEQKLSV